MLSNLYDSLGHITSDRCNNCRPLKIEKSAANIGYGHGNTRLATQIAEVCLSLEAFETFIGLAKRVFGGLPGSLSMLELLGGDRLAVKQILIALVILGSEIKIVFALGDNGSLLGFFLVKLANLADGLPQLGFSLFQRYIGVVLI